MKVNSADLIFEYHSEFFPDMYSKRKQSQRFFSNQEIYNFIENILNAM
jgi:hypothetical protein